VGADHARRVDQYLSAPARIFIVSSPPPNLGGRVANLDANVRVDGGTGNTACRWYGGLTARRPALPW
jgi:hypothetical protein